MISKIHNFPFVSLALAGLLASGSPVLAAKNSTATSVAPQSQTWRPGGEPGPDQLFQPREVKSSGTVTVGGKSIAYDAYAGTLVVHAQGWNDTAWRDEAAANGGKDQGHDAPPPEASMFYTAYFAHGAPSADRPITFIYNGGPGSATIWLHMGAFGPRKVVTADHDHTPAAPYSLVNNANSLLDASDLVFIDAPGTGYSRIAGKDAKEAFWGVDEDAAAFDQFIKAFLTHYQRWNSPKFLFGESYGTPRSAVLINKLQNDDLIDFNGVMLLSQILNYDLSVDDPERNPSIDTPYVTALPSMAAVAWYHDRLGSPRPALQPLLSEVERFATTDYAAALAQGAALDPATRQSIAEKLAHFTGLPTAYILKSNLRVSGGQFAHELLGSEGRVTGRLDARFSGYASDPLAKVAQYDPMNPAISSAYIAAFHDYTAKALKWPARDQLKVYADVFGTWDFRHQPPGWGGKLFTATNVMPDLAEAMKRNPNLKVLAMGGYFDLGTPFFEGIYEMRHLPIPAELQKNISYKYFESGHMVYANAQAAAGLHDAAAAFVRANSHS